MKKGIQSKFLMTGLAVLLSMAHILIVRAQGGDETLKLNQETKFVLKNKQQKVLILNLKKGDFTEIDWKDALQRFPNFSILTPSGQDLTKEIYMDGPTMFVAKESGAYKLTARFDDDADNRDGQISVSYANVFKLPASAKLQRQRQVNGYNIQVYNMDGDDSASYLVIKKNGKLEDILRGGSIVGGGFNFADEQGKDVDDAKVKKSDVLVKTTTDKTGDGTPDIAVGFFTGGAHCCFDLHFYELGNDGVRKIKVINGEDSGVIAIGKQSSGGLILETGDSNFTYWLTSFAGSPIPSVILTFQNGEFRPDVKLMKKTAPSMAVLREKAAEAKKDISLEPYKGDENMDFTNAFWGEMLDLLYSGNEPAAWQYFDLVWDSRKPGKEKFKADFLKQLNKSEYWQMMQAAR